MQPPSLTGLKKPRQLNRIRLIGAQLNCVDSGRAKEPRQIGLGTGLSLSETAALASVAGVDLDNFTGLGIVKHQPTQSREFKLKPIGNLHCDDVMPSIGLAQHGK